MKELHGTPMYKAWIRVSKISIFLVIVVILLIAIGVIENSIVRLLLFTLLLLFSYILIIISSAYYYFTKKGYQQKIHQTIANLLNPTINVNLLDIGAGSGSLSVIAAKILENSHITGIDYWGDNWEYSKELCEKNIEIEGLKGIKFIKGSASDLPFKNGEFDTIISCLTFHEVQDEPNIYKVLKEAHRCLKPGGQFIYLDLFLDSKIYPDLEINLTEQQITNYELIKLEDLIAMPLILKHKKVLGSAAILVGYKIN